MMLIQPYTGTYIFKQYWHLQEAKFNSFSHDVDQSLIGWNDPETSYDNYNIIFDVPYEGMKRSKRLKGVPGII